MMNNNNNENIYDDAASSSSSTTTTTVPTAIPWKTEKTQVPQFPSTTAAPALPTRFSSSTVEAATTTTQAATTADMVLPQLAPMPSPPPPSPQYHQHISTAEEAGFTEDHQAREQQHLPFPPITTSDFQEREQPPPPQLTSLSASTASASASTEKNKKTVTFADDITRVDFHDDFNGSLHDIEPMDCDVSHLYYSRYELDQISADINMTIRLALSLLDNDVCKEQPQDTAMSCLRGLESQILRKICCQKTSHYGSSSKGTLYSTYKAKTKRREIRKNRIQSIQAVLVEQYYQQQAACHQAEQQQLESEYHYVGDNNNSSNNRNQNDTVSNQNASQLAHIYHEYSLRSIEQAIQMGTFDEQQAVTDSLQKEDEVTYSPFYSSLLIDNNGKNKQHDDDDDDDELDEYSSDSTTIENDDQDYLIYNHSPTTTANKKSTFPFSYNYYKYDGINNKGKNKYRHNYGYINDSLFPATTAAAATTRTKRSIASKSHETMILHEQQQQEEEEVSSSSSPLILSIVALD